MYFITDLELLGGGLINPTFDKLVLLIGGTQFQ